ncbi:putative phosphatidate cytidylyltransferase [Selenomonas ruminantium subsp. lactilytica TAM6421]|uniref:Phosphatidate cytidylyltransferase n=1 Tax=Selenomonas ruminantium subsp. lactilytica (strain NBRC 103574 / TAM6421) TaxID=927704 RepID=I0GNH4_SELRL|nr:phosphatidate cytidylyltransferase [Selenomonas ruminantium]BAL82311.1 putative phosphatidate cytidylyltransferase [Selenomonas ruminantium subsp. lactilytica TAM6421]
MLLRIITGIIGIAAAAFVIQTGGVVFAGFTLLLMLLAWFEYARAFSERGMGLSLVTGFIALGLMWYAAWQKPEFLAMACPLIIMVTLLESVLLRASTGIMDALASGAGLIYIGFPFTCLLLLRNFLPDTVFTTEIGNFTFGNAFVWIMFIGTWASDTFAYFTGTAIGRHKLCPSISPNKTIEGFMGSLVGTTAVVAGLGYFLNLPLQAMAILGLAIAILATLGDLVESVAKRYVGIKDSGNIIPGHGGVWDRFDSVLFTAPLVYYFVQFVNLLGK